jgi:hypothetical protein
MKLVSQIQLVGRLCLSLDRYERHIGLFLFDELDIESIPQDLLGKAADSICWLLLHEAQCATITGAGAGRCLISLIGQIQRMGEEFSSSLKEELILQAKNYGGECGELFAKKASENKMLEEVVSAREMYFKALAESKSSPLWKMQVPGYSRAMEEFHRNFGNEVDQGARKHSVLMEMVHSVALLYGRSWSTFHGQQLGPTTKLSKIGHSMELPRLELIDPEQMQLRRLYAHREIQNIELSFEKVPS